MANEISLACQLSYLDSLLQASSLTLPTGVTASVATKMRFAASQVVTTTQAALNLGPITSLGWFIGINRDSTNFMQILSATSGTKICKMLAGEPALFRFDTTITAPFVISNTASVTLDYILVSL